MKNKQILSFLSCLVACCFLQGCSSQPPLTLTAPQEATTTSAEAPSPTPEPTLTPSPTPTPTPTPEPTPAPTPDPWAAYFSEEEVVRIVDGKSWSYTSPTLGVFIEKRFVEDCSSDCFIAHVYNPGGQDILEGVIRNEDGTVERVRPWTLARHFKAVIAITGSYFSYFREGTVGPEIRNGYWYKDNMGEQCMVILPKTGAFYMFRKGREDYTQEYFQKLNIQYSFSFGPILVEDGQLCEDIATHRLSGRNPRCAVGMVEPGHYVLIMVEGRRPDSPGATFNQLARLFIAEGCVNAYNMDGGDSSAMVFMGEVLNTHDGEYKEIGYRSLIDMLMFGTSQMVPENEAES